MSDVANQPRVPARVVLLSLAALWACYFLVATLRGAIMGYEFVWAIFSRRLTICILSMLVMAAVWPLLQMLERKSGGVRLAIVLIGALPLAFLLSVINQTVFSDIEMSPAYGSEEEAEAVKSGNVRISRDDAGNILLDLPTSVTQPAPRLPGTPTDDASAPSAPAPPEPTTTSDNKAHSITIHTNKSLGEEYGRWATVTDYAFTRYFLVLAWAALYFALAKAEEARVAERREGEHRRAAAAAELRSLRYQVNPHFLFNTLNSLSALVMTGKQDDAETMIQTLSTFYRRTLSGDPTSDLKLVDEIELQKLYFDIEAVRFPNRLVTTIDIDDAVSDAMVPGMILQPLVENSVKYAVAATQRPVTIAIRAQAEGDTLVISVSDDGPGGKVKGVQGFGIGLGNVRDRLRARYGNAAQITFGRREEGGFATVLRLPLNFGSPSAGPLEHSRA
ncbi:sensor histidine kinase [Novosphingobium sp. KA1]|uniref:sensor histidine kinase n=1 Tax=Novosphingobium sp. (strain KA1) TaxID=164608 RepID=UPI001A8E5889|nr:histidine kinase [Novosphingobium sp. KA1]QSR16906.1 histidine kinase [Novosphingobium sp. KA1]